VMLERNLSGLNMPGGGGGVGGGWGGGGGGVNRLTDA
jgi:hypothetical protein